MSPDTLANLRPQAREALHMAAWTDAVVQPSLMPDVPVVRAPYDPKLTVAALAIRNWRDQLEAAFFPEDKEVG